MNTRRFAHLAARIRRGLLVAAALIGYLAGAVGFPVPVPLVKDTSQPFPCQDHACGCQTAEQCWKSCCCYTAEERLAWARAHHVEPPTSVVAEADKGWHTPRQRDQQEKPAVGASCSRGCCSAEKTKTAAPKKGGSWVVGLMARHCRGQSSDWFGGATSFPPPRPVSWSYEWTPAEWLPSSDVHSVCCISSPTPPPPRG